MFPLPDNGLSRHAPHNASTQSSTFETKNYSVARPVETSERHVYQPSEGRADACELTIASYNIHKCIENDGVFDPLRSKMLYFNWTQILWFFKRPMRGSGNVRVFSTSTICTSWAVTDLSSAQTAVRAAMGGTATWCYTAMVPLTMFMTRLPGSNRRRAHRGLWHRRRPFACLGAPRSLKAVPQEQVEAILEAADASRAPCDCHRGHERMELESRSALELFKSHFVEVSAQLPSYPSRYPVLPLDRLFVSRGLRVESLNVVDTPLTRIASDHLPVNATISIESSIVD